MHENLAVKSGQHNGALLEAPKYLKTLILMHSKANAEITLVMDVFAKLSVQTYRSNGALGFTATSLGNFCSKFQARQQRGTMIHGLPCCP